MKKKTTFSDEMFNFHFAKPKISQNEKKCNTILDSMMYRIGIQLISLQVPWPESLCGIFIFFPRSVTRPRTSSHTNLILMPFQ